jgi:hypothetical protein
MPPDAATHDTLRWLLPIFSRRKADGTPYYTNAEVYAFLPVFALTLGVDRATAPPWLLERLTALLVAAGVEPTDPPEALGPKLQSYLAANPLNPELMAEVRRGLREELSGYSPEELVDGALRLLGAERGLKAQDAPPPPGAVRAGPLARFTIEAPDEPAPGRTSPGAGARGSRARGRRR